MITVSRRFALGACVLATVLGMIPGCTYLDRFLPGEPFSFGPPVAEVTLDGQMHIDRASGGPGCTAGGTLLWGAVRNTGNVYVVDVSITIDAYAASGAFLGSFKTGVYSGIAAEAEDTNSFDQASTDLQVGEIGTFEVCTPLPFGSVARTEYRTAFVTLFQ